MEQEQIRLRQLEPQEHSLTKDLYHAVFPEDDDAFVAYYYFHKTRDNAIFAIEKRCDETGDATAKVCEQEIVAMLHLNPYHICLNDEAFLGHYIVAVATKEKCRGKGFMRRLLVNAMAHMYEQKEPFTYLMPAAEAIYQPFDFVTVRDGKQSLTLSGSGANLKICPSEALEQDAVNEELNSSITYERAKEVVYQVDEAISIKTSLRALGMQDAPLLAGFFTQHIAAHLDVYTIHDEAYYQTMVLEQQIQGGGLLGLFANESLVAYAAWAKEADKIILRESMTLPGYQDTFAQTVLQTLDGERNTGSLSASANELTAQQEKDLAQYERMLWKPHIMLRIVHLPCFLEALHVRDGEEINLSLAFLDEHIPQNTNVYRIRSVSVSEASTAEMPKRAMRLKATVTEDSQGILPIQAFTAYIFGQISLHELLAKDQVILSAEACQELEKLQKPEHLLFNEVV